MSGHCILVKRKRREKVGGRWRGTYGVGDEVGRGGTIRGDRSTEPRICARRGRPFLPFPVLRVLPEGEKMGYTGMCRTAQRGTAQRDRGFCFRFSSTQSSRTRHTQQNSRNQPGAHYHEPQNHRSVHQRKSKNHNPTANSMPTDPRRRRKKKSLV